MDRHCQFVIDLLDNKIKTINAKAMLNENNDNDCPFSYCGNCNDQYQMKDSPNIEWNIENIKALT